MACSINVQNRPVVRSLEAVDLPPPPLADLHILDLLELTGSQFKAAEVLAMHQSTVSRSLRMMSQQFHYSVSAGPRPAATAAMKACICCGSPIAHTG